MDTHDQQNKAGPQNESSPVFRGGPISQSEMQSNNQTYNHRDSNPYRLRQSSPGDNANEHFETTAHIQGSGIWQQIKGRLFKEEPGVNNTRQKVMVILIPILFIIMVFMFRQVLSKNPQKTEGATDGYSPVTTVHSDNVIEWRIPEPMPMQIRDPIKPRTQNAVSNTWQTDSNNIGILNVRGILYSQDKPSAVIGNRIVHLNDKIDNATIIQIDREFVVFERDGKRWTKRVAELEVEQEEKEQIENNMETNDIQSLEE